jgi:hypothetical protein
MFKKITILFSLILVSIIFLLPGNAKAFNLPTKTIDQACVEPSVGTVHVGMVVPGTFQVFSPTMDILDSASAFIAAVPGTTVPVRAKIFHHTASGVMENFAVSINTVMVTDTPSWKAFEMENKPMPAGNYSLMLQVATRDGGEVYWYAKDDGNCYPNGYAVVDSHPDHSKDFNFVIFGKNSGTNSGTDSDPDSAASDDASVDSSTSDSDSSTIAAPKTTAASNKQSADSKALMSSPQKQEEFNQAMIDALIADFKKENPRGIFGIGGFVGDVLTWINIAIFFGVIAFLVIVFVLLFRKKRPIEEKK